MAENGERRAEELYEQRSNERRDGIQRDDAERSRPVVSDFHKLRPLAVENLARLDYPVPSDLITYEDEQRVAWKLYSRYDVQFSAFLLATGEVVFNGVTSGTHFFDADDLLKPEMETDLRYCFSNRPQLLIYMNEALAELAKLDF